MTVSHKMNEIAINVILTIINIIGIKVVITITNTIYNHNYSYKYNNNLQLQFQLVYKTGWLTLARTTTSARTCPSARRCSSTLSSENRGKHSTRFLQTCNNISQT